MNSNSALNVSAKMMCKWSITNSKVVNKTNWSSSIGANTRFNYNWYIQKIKLISRSIMIAPFSTFAIWPTIHCQCEFKRKQPPFIAFTHLSGPTPLRWIWMSVSTMPMNWWTSSDSLNMGALLHTTPEFVLASAIDEEEESRKAN